MNAQQPCPLCGLPASISGRANQDVADVRCRKCGYFAVAPDLMAFDLTLSHIPAFLRDKGVCELAQAAKLLKAYLSIYTRECAENGKPPELLNFLDLPALELLANTYSLTPVTSKPDRLLRLLERRTAYPGALASFNPQLDCPAIHAVSALEFHYYLEALADQGFIVTAGPRQVPSGKSSESANPDATYAATITLTGWARLGATCNGSRSTFIAMSFHHSLDDAFSQGILRAVDETGYLPLRVDKEEYNGKICDRIVVDIKRSRFVVADVTRQRQGVYFEAGFAMALGLPVIWSCREDDLKNVHFDTRQYNHIVWKEPADFRRQLHDRIVATIGSVR